jgi:Mor family transcriptional regulator
VGLKVENNGDLYNEMEALIGAEAAGVLFEHYAGNSVYFPRNYAVERLHEQIRTEFKNGAYYGELARKYEYSVSRIRAIIHKKNIVDESPDLGL